MHLSLTDQQELVRQSARDYLHDRFTRETLARIAADAGGCPESIWREMAGLGWMGLVIPEAYGGVGMGFLELALLLEEMGRVRPLSPFFSTVVLGALPILETGSEAQKRSLLPAIAAGDAVWTLAWLEEGASHDAGAIRCTAAADGEGYRIDGVKLFVPDAQRADHLLCIARMQGDARAEESLSVFVVDANSAGLRCTPCRGLNDDWLCEVRFDGVRVPADRLLGRPGGGWSIASRLLDIAAVAKCCEMVGGARRVLEMTVAYAKERRQFDRPIGSFQAIQHHCANMLADVDASWIVSYEAAWRIAAGLPCAAQASMAKAWVGEAYRRVAALGHQVHGGVGLIDEHDLPRYFKAARVAGLAFGDARFHTRKVAERLGYA